MVPIILASSSPRRKELLQGLGIKFFVDANEVNETVLGETSPGRIVEVVALRKVQAVASRYREGLIIGCDTVVVFDSTIFGKPLDEKDSLRMLMRLQGKEHRVFSGLAVLDSSSGKQVCEHEVTTVKFRPISEAEAIRYVASGEPKGKAGAYAIQGLGAIFVKGIEGDYFNVVGLPLFKLSRMLKEFGVEIV